MWVLRWNGRGETHRYWSDAKGGCAARLSAATIFESREKAEQQRSMLLITSLSWAVIRWDEADKLDIEEEIQA